MIANYHTHTWRCKHATGTEEEYVQAAVKRGLKRLGFADHSPYCFPDGYYSNFRMKPEDTADYANDIFTLRDRYRDSIDIRLGVEIEYYPAFFADTVSMLRDNQVEYLILGQHFLDNEMGGSAYSGIPSTSTDDLQKYCRQVMDACHTGLVTYIAHPDLFHYKGDTATYQRAMKSAGILPDPGHYYFMDNHKIDAYTGPQTHFRLNIAAPRPLLAEAIRRIQSIF